MLEVCIPSLPSPAASGWETGGDDYTIEEPLKEYSTPPSSTLYSSLSFMLTEDVSSCWGLLIGGQQTKRKGRPGQPGFQSPTEAWPLLTAKVDLGNHTAILDHQNFRPLYLDHAFFFLGTPSHQAEDFQARQLGHICQQVQAWGTYHQERRESHLTWQHCVLDFHHLGWKPSASPVPVPATSSARMEDQPGSWPGVPYQEDVARLNSKLDFLFSAFLLETV